MKDGEKWYYRGYYVASVSNPIPKSIYLNSSFGLTCLEAEVEKILSMNTSINAYVDSREIRRLLFLRILLEDFDLANQLLSAHELRIYSVKIEQYEPLDDSNDNQTSLF